MSSQPDIKTMYQYATHKNIPWNIVEYQPVPQYLDAAKMQKEREGTAQPQKYATKRGFYMDYLIKTVKELPAPSHYEAWQGFQKLKHQKHKHHKVDRNVRKNTYLDQIIDEQTNRPKPGVAKYHLSKTQKERKEELKEMEKHQMCLRKQKAEKRYFYQDDQFLSTEAPGAGNYNPRLSVDHVKKQRHDPKYYIDKHQKQGQTQRKRRLKEPDPGTYRPLSMEHKTFDGIRCQSDKNRKRDKSSKSSKSMASTGFGTDARFSYMRPDKKKIKEQRPCPTHYETAILWKGKGVDPRKKSWVRCLSARQTQPKSVYH